MDFLKAEIERKKRLVEEKGVTAGPQKKYFRRGDLAEKERQEYLKRHSAPSNDDEKVKQIKQSKEEARKALLGTSSSKDEDVSEGAQLPRVEVVRRLRERLQPILLFGETLAQACNRLRQIEIDAPESSSGITNDFQEARDKVDQVYLQEMIKSSHDDDSSQQAGTSSGSSSLGGGTGKKSSLEVDLYDSRHTYDDLLEMAHDLDKGDFDHDRKVVSEFIKVMLRLWGQELNSRDDEVKQSVKGKTEATTYTQSRIYLKPLLRMLKKQTLTDDIRDSLVQMVKETLQRNYIASHERYMEMAIGNAPWPIGVTNAGIHARPARENIFSKHVAHVLNDETQRKFIQGLKRLLTKAQQYYPTDPSRSVDFVKGKPAAAVASSSKE